MDLDIAIWRLNPQAAYLMNEDHTAIAEWRGPGDQPTGAELQAAYDAWVVEWQAAEQAEQEAEANRVAMRLRFAAHVLAGKTPAQIYTFLQDRINGWTKLSDAKSDLADLLPLLATSLAWMVMERDR